MPRTVFTALHRPCAQLPPAPRWRPGGGRREVEGRASDIPAATDELFSLLLMHRERSKREREHAGTVARRGCIFTQPNGKPLDPKADYEQWRTLLTEAGVREARLHDARHTAATVLLILGVPDRTVMDVMGWSTASMKARYMHVTEDIRRDVAERLNGYFREATET